MAHEVTVSMTTKTVLHKDLEIVVSEIQGPKTRKMGTLLISQGNIEWLGAGRSVNKKRLTWKQFEKLVEEHGKVAKVK